MSDLSIEQIETYLSEARTAYHTLTIGGAVRVVVDQNQERVEYTAANSARLAQYIASLERKLARLRGERGYRGPRIRIK